VSHLQELAKPEPPKVKLIFGTPKTNERIDPPMKQVKPLELEEEEHRPSLILKLSTYYSCIHQVDFRTSKVQATEDAVMSIEMIHMTQKKRDAEEELEPRKKAKLSSSH
jgi:hypothetical protein